MARIEVGIEKNPALIELYKELKKKVEKKEIIFPISVNHLIETLKIKDVERRKLLAKVMINFSKANTIIPYSKIFDAEVRQEICRRLGIKTPDLRKVVFGKGISHLFSKKMISKTKREIIHKMYPEKEKEILNYVESEKMMELLLSHEKIEKDIIENSYIEVNLIKKLEKIRKEDNKIKDNNRRKKVTMAKFMTDMIIPEFMITHIKLNLPKDAILNETWTERDAIDFFQHMPTLYTNFCLTDRRDRLKTRGIHPHDLFDIAALSIAIPYCDIVVAEKMTISFARDEKLGELYTTKLLTSLIELKKELQNDKNIRSPSDTSHVPAEKS